MFHPFLWISESSRTRVFRVFFALAAALMIILQLLGAPLKTAGAPAGIVSYELAGSAAESRKVLASWDAGTRASAGLNLGAEPGAEPAGWPAVARACAIPKFLILAPGLPYLLVSGVVVLAQKRPGKRSAPAEQG